MRRFLVQDFLALCSPRYLLDIGKIPRVPGIEFMNRPFAKQIDFDRQLIEIAHQYFYRYFTNYSPMRFSPYFKRNWWYRYRNSLWFVEQTRYFGDFYPHKRRPVPFPFDCQTGIDAGDTDEGRQDALALMHASDRNLSSGMVHEGGFSKRVLNRRNCF